LKIKSLEANSLPPAPATARCASGYMLGNPCIPHYLVTSERMFTHGDNVPGAENQQERLSEFCGWVIGFVDGEGCFSISFTRQPDRVERRGYKTGYQVLPRFAVTQGAQSLACLEELKEFFGVGRIYVNRRHDNHKEHLCQFVVSRRTELVEVIIPFFRRHPLHTAKQADFQKFAYCVDLMVENRHVAHDGLTEIVEIAQTMNHRKPRHELLRILRGHTPDIRATG
jgi:hypothetical protein